MKRIVLMKEYPRVKLTVLCGHTYEKKEAEILPNLYVKTGGAAYGKSKIQEVFDVI